MPTYAWPVSGSTFASPSPGRSVPFLGRGLFSPLREDAVTGDFQRVTDEENVKQCIRDGVLTAIGERVMAESIGTVTPELLFEESTVVTDLLPPSIRDFFDHFEFRALLQDIAVQQTSMTAEMSSFNVSVVYVLRATNKRENLVFPFYLTSAQAA